MKVCDIQFPHYSGLRCLMMPYIQGEPESVPSKYRAYSDILSSVFVRRGQIGYLTIDESPVQSGQPHRGARAKYDRALHTEAGIHPDKVCSWGGTTTWGSDRRVTLDRDVRVLIANSIDNTCAIWYADRDDTSLDGDIGHLADQYPYTDAVLMKAGEVHQIGILTPHESLRVSRDAHRQFLRIVGAGVHGREPYFTENPLCAFTS